MKNVLIGIFAGISALSLGYIAYDEFIKEEKVIYKECNKEELCDECICDDNDDDNEENLYEFNSSSVYDNNGNIYTLQVYERLQPNVIIKDVELNGKPLKIEIKDHILYVGNNEISHADTLYVTNDHIFVGVVAQCGLIFKSVVDENGKMTSLLNQENINSFQVDKVYLKENGSLLAIGSSTCGTQYIVDETVTFNYINNKLEITKTKLK